MNMNETNGLATGGEKLQLVEQGRDAYITLKIIIGGA